MKSHIKQWYEIKDMGAEPLDGDVVCVYKEHADQAFIDCCTNSASPDYDEGEGLFVKISSWPKSQTVGSILIFCANYGGEGLRYFRLTDKAPGLKLNKFHSSPAPLP